MTDREILNQLLGDLGVNKDTIDTVWSDTSLELLDLSGNQLTTLPDSIGNLTSLTHLYLSDNQLISLPDSIGNLTSLTELYLRGNQFINNDSAIFSSEIGSRNEITVYFTKKDHIICGCWHGTMAEFEDRINSVYSSGQYHDEYMAFIGQCKNRQTKEINK